MENVNREKTSFNIRLAKLIGLYQILYPKTDKFLGYNVYHIAAVFASLYICLVSAMPCLNSIFYWKYHKVESILYSGIVGYILFTCYKMMTIVRHSSTLWECLSLTQFNLTSCGKRYGAPMEACRKRTFLFTYTFVAIVYTGVISYTVCPLVFNDTFLTMTDFKGSTGTYRLNVFKFYAPISSETYNDFFGIFYLIETVYAIITIAFINICDIFTITICIAISAQLQTISAAFESFGHYDIHDISLPRSTKHTNINEELKTIIIDHQTVIKKLEIFINIFGKAIMFQIAVCSLMLIIVIFTGTMNVIDGGMTNLKSTLFNVPSAFYLLMYQIFVPCYLFENIHEQKESVTFALYSSNWTEMNLKCKKLILLAMRMNNAHRLKLKFTYTRIVNLEMFCNTMRVCYTILSMLMKYRKSINK